MSIVKKFRSLLLALLIVLAVTAVLTLTSTRFAGFVVSLVIPEFPYYPPARLRLMELDEGKLYFVTYSPYDFDVIINDLSVAPQTTGIGYLSLPDNASPDQPVPAMILLHGSGGIKEDREQEYARLLNENGIAAFLINYYMPRGVTEDTNYFLGAISSTEFDIVADAYSSLNLLSTHPSIDPQRIGVMGFSYGGMAVKAAIDDRVRQQISPDSPGFAVFVDFYGPCFQNFGTTQVNGAPLLTLRGDADASNDLVACRKREDEYRALGMTVQTHIYPGAGHAWEADMEEDQDSPYIRGCEIQYDEMGRAFVNDTYLVDVPLETTREQRIASRLRTGAALLDCVHEGYSGGRHDATKQKSDRHLIDFLTVHLQPQS